MLKIIIVNVTCYQFRQITLKQVCSDCNMCIARPLVDKANSIHDMVNNIVITLYITQF